MSGDEGGINEGIGDEGGRGGDSREGPGIGDEGGGDGKGSQTGDEGWEGSLSGCLIVVITGLRGDEGLQIAIHNKKVSHVSMCFTYRVFPLPPGIASAAQSSLGHFY